MTPHETKLSDLQQRIEVIDTKIASLNSEFEDCAASFDGHNGKEALKRAETIERSQDALHRERALAIAAQHKVQELQQAEAEQAEQDQRQVAQAEAKLHADAIITTHGEIDSAFQQITQLLERRLTLLHSLANTGVVDRTLMMKLSGKSSPTAAAAAAGLHKFLDVNAPAPGSLRTLSSSNAVLAGIGGHGQPQPRVELNGGGK